MTTSASRCELSTTHSNRQVAAAIRPMHNALLARLTAHVHAWRQLLHLHRLANHDPYWALRHGGRYCRSPNWPGRRKAGITLVATRTGTCNALASSDNCAMCSRCMEARACFGRRPMRVLKSPVPRRIGKPRPTTRSSQLRPHHTALLPWHSHVFTYIQSPKYCKYCKILQCQLLPKYCNVTYYKNIAKYCKYCSVSYYTHGTPARRPCHLPKLALGAPGLGSGRA